MSRPFLRTLIFTLAVMLGMSAFALAEPEQFQMGHDIHIAPDQRTGDVTCINCSIYIRGHVAGDAFALNGNVVVETGGELGGDVSTLHGDVRVADGAKIGGDVAAIAGTVRKQSTAEVGGDVTSMAGAWWTLLVVFVPIFLLGGIAVLIVWMVQRVVRPAPVRVAASASQMR